MKAKDTSVAGLTKGIEFLFKKNNVEYIKGTGAFQDEHTVAVNLVEGGETTVRGKNILIATGSEATPFPGLTIDEKKVITSTGAIALQEVPKKMTVIGGGIIGLEMASVWSRLGSEVTVVEYLGQIGGPGMDKDVAKQAQKLLQKQGMKFKLNTKVTAGDAEGEGVKVTVEAAKGGKEETLDADVVLVAIGRRPYTNGLGLENIGLEVDERGRVIIDQEYRTKIPHIRAIGDVTFGPMLAHKAEEESVAVVEYISKGYGHVNYGAIPSVMYTHPEVAWVGQNEQELKAANVKYNVGQFPFSANSRAKTNLDTEGFVKFISDAETDRILGIHIIGPNAGEMIAEGVLALEYGASSEGESMFNLIQGETNTNNHRRRCTNITCSPYPLRGIQGGCYGDVRQGCSLLDFFLRFGFRLASAQEVELQREFVNSTCNICRMLVHVQESRLNQISNYVESRVADLLRLQTPAINGWMARARVTCFRDSRLRRVSAIFKLILHFPSHAILPSTTTDHEHHRIRTAL